LSTISQQKYALNKRRAKKYLYICKKSVNSDFIPRVIEAIVEHKPDKKWLRPKKLRSIAGIACRVIL
jgi:hypothetical protein